MSIYSRSWEMCMFQLQPNIHVPCFSAVHNRTICIIKWFQKTLGHIKDRQIASANTHYFLKLPFGNLNKLKKRVKRPNILQLVHLVKHKVHAFSSVSLIPSKRAESLAANRDLSMEKTKNTVQSILFQINAKTYKEIVLNLALSKSKCYCSDYDLMCPTVQRHKTNHFSKCCAAVYIMQTKGQIT